MRHLIQARANEAEYGAMALYEMYELAIQEMRRNADGYAEIGLEIGTPVYHRLMRRCTDPVSLGPRPHLKHAAEAYKMREE